MTRRAGWRYEMHSHTGEFGWCAHVPAATLVRDYAAAGYDGVVITNHYFERGFDAMEAGDWPGLVAEYLIGYEAARRAAEGTGLDVLLGLEIRFTEAFDDYLIFGVDEAFLLAHPRLYTMGLEAFRRLADAERLFVAQAHPFRKGCRVADARLLDGLEVYNGNPRHDNGNDEAAAYARRHGLIGIAGSDYHQLQDLGTGATILGRRPEDSRSLGRLLLDGGVVGLEPTP